MVLVLGCDVGTELNIGVANYTLPLPGDREQTHGFSTKTCTTHMREYMNGLWRPCAEEQKIFIS